MPLQLLLRRHPEWVSHPAVVVDEDRPQGRILWANELAQRARILPGRRYAAGLALASDLRAGTVSEVEITAAGNELLGLLREFTPDIEPSDREPGVFWLDATGVEGLYPSLTSWAEQLVERLRAASFAATLVVGFDRFQTYALARAGEGIRVLPSRRRERDLADRVPLDRLGFDPGLRDALHALGVEDVGSFRRLPPGGIRERFGVEAHALHRLAQGEVRNPLAPQPDVPPPSERYEVEPGDHDIDVPSLLFLCKQRLARLVALLQPRGQSVEGLVLRLLFEKGEPREERIAPAQPTLDEVQLTELLRLRLESVRLAATDSLVGFELDAEAIETARVQRQLFQERPKRDLSAGNRALARLRAEFGDGAVVRATLQPGHLPEARFRWRPMLELAIPRPDPVDEPRMVRRVLANPKVLLAQNAGADGWFARGLGAGPIYNLFGPYVVSGGWWRREQHREYYFAETRRGDVLWIYFDRHLRLWSLQGVIE